LKTHIISFLLLSYCQNGTKTSDPFRNDTTLRPYACSPGTFCFAGTGSNEVRENVVGFAQPCHAGFFCHAASTSAKGMGACPPGFECPKGTANPRPTPKGFYAEHPGTIESAACLPGFYAPTIQTDKCYECPPGTSCMYEGLFEAEECGPGMYRSTNDEVGNICTPCPQGTWSKNWGLRERGECTRCPTGVVCPLDGMTNPCSYEDLPTPYEPIVNSQGMPAFEYEFPTDLRPPPFSMDECQALNSGTEKSSRSPEYFFGELVPPYIDILGRGPHFRPSDQNSLKYQSVAKCYKNSQPQGSLVYMRMAEYYGPQYDIQTGFPHQGYGTSFLNNQIYATAPPEGFDFSLTYFRGEGNGYIDLPKARVYEPAFNCTKGIQLMNSTLVKEDVKRVVYTDPTNDYEGGYDIEKCPVFDLKLDCYINESGDCCNIDKLEQRAIYMAHDQFYHGTCEADLICEEGGLAPPQAKPCQSGFVCDEKTTLESSMNYPCPAGFVCDEGTTPNTKLIAPASQLKQLCPAGMTCGHDEFGQPNQSVCPENHWCPTGTADASIGSLANDSLLRLLNFGSSRDTSPRINLQYQGGDSFALLNDHDDLCTRANFPSLETRFDIELQNQTNINYLEYLADKSVLPITINEGTQYKEQCARDNKSAFVQDAMRRRECKCHSQFLTLTSVYRFWKCTSSSPLDDLGLGDVSVPPSSGRGKRDFWYPHSRIHRDLESAVATDPSMEVFGLQYGEGSVCTFPHSHKVLSLTEGRLPNEEELPIISTLQKHPSGYLDLDNGLFSVRFTSITNRSFDTYEDLKSEVRAEYNSERHQVATGNRSNIDPFVFDLHTSINLIEQFGQRLEEIVYMNDTNKSSPSSIELVLGQGNNTYLQKFDFVLPLDWCECQTLLQCSNGTISDEGSTTLDDCVSTKNEVLHRISLLPPEANLTANVPLTREGTVDESSTLNLDPFDVAVLTIDQSELPHNFTYGEHYQISIYDGCKPCPIRYQCKQSSRGSSDAACRYPSKSRQMELLNDCLKQNRKEACLRSDGSHEQVETCHRLLFEQDGVKDGVASDGSFVLFSEPDLDKCLTRSYFCLDKSWNFLSYRRLCQDTKDDGSLSPVYNCSDVQRWETYSQWRDGICCADQVPELRGFNACQDDKTCIDDPQVESIIRDKLIGVFELDYGYIPPKEEPKGMFLMNAKLQADIDNDSPIDLFDEYQEAFNEEQNAVSSPLHNKYKPESSSPWLETSGCCKCRRQSMPAFFATNYPVSGYPDDKHQPIQLTISALAKVDLTVVVELVHGRYYADFSDYFSPMDKTMLRIHSPKRFAEKPVTGQSATWLTVVEQNDLDKWSIDLPLNLPPNNNKAYNTIEGIESRFLVDRPSNITIGDERFANISLGLLNGITTSATSDPIETEDSWWSSHNFLALPYLPFFSNCNGYDSHISLSRLLEEHPDCESVTYDQTVPTKEYAVRGEYPVSDTCLGTVLTCTYEEDIRGARKDVRWYEAAPGTVLFHIVSIFDDLLMNGMIVF